MDVEGEYMRRIILKMQYIALLTFLYSSFALATSGIEDTYLLKPTGVYGVGYQDVFLLNTNICPDAFYQKNINENDFSPSNKRHCHEIALRIYYPSRKDIQLGDEYYAPYLTSQIDWFVKKLSLSEQDVAKLNTVLKVKTYTFANAKPVDKQKFPIILFMPGSGTPAQAYNNIISDLVSNGYIVVGINSLFTNGALQLSNGHIVSPPNPYSDADGRMENISDLKFVLDHLAEIEYKANLKKQMDFSNVGLMGHSRGAMSIVNLIKLQENQAYKNIKAIILMDPGDMLLQENYPLQKSSIPAMTMWSSSFKNGMHGETLLGANNYEVILKPKNVNDDFSEHNNFTDNSTMQYHPACKVASIHKQIGVGDGDGYEIATKLNTYVLSFFNHYLKSNVQSESFDCEDLNYGYLLICGH